MLFKPLNDSQWIDRWLKAFPTARAIWLYRDYHDVAASAVRKWGSHQREVVKEIARGRLNQLGWRGERLSDETLAIVNRLYTDDLSDIAAAAIKWHVRNQLFFELGLDRIPRVLVVKYEELATEPARAFPRLFHALGTPYDSQFVANVFSSSVGRNREIELPPEVRRVCDQLLERLDRVYRTQQLGLSKGIPVETSSTLAGSH